MEVIDAQLHDIGPRLNWKSPDDSVRQDVLTELMLAWMDAVGVDKTLVHPRDEAWATSAIRAYPDRFAGVFRVRDPEAPDVEEQVIRSRALPGAVGLRLSFGKLPTDPAGRAGATKFKAGIFNRFFAACEKHAVPLFCSAYGYVSFIGDIARQHPTLGLIVDHMGIAQPPLNPRESPPWKSLPDLLQLASYPNVAVKLCGAPVLSNEPFPFKDVRPYLHEILNAFSADRTMWASDIGRFAGRVGWENIYPEAHGDYPGKHHYAESLFLIRAMDELSAAEKERILGGTVRRLLGWPGNH